MPLGGLTPSEPEKKIVAKRKAVPPEYTPAENASLMQKLGGGALSGLHVVGSILNTPSRLLWGTVNALQGGEGGFGNLNPIDSTGGIELSHVLANNGVIAKNDPNSWELMPTTGEDGVFNPGDFGRGLIDMAGDPTSWLTPFGLTKAGQASKIGAAGAAPLEKGLVNQLAAGQRGLVGLNLPLGTKSMGAALGPETADVLRRADAGLSGVGLPSISEAALSNPVTRNIRAIRNYRFQGKTHPLLHPEMEDYTSRLEVMQRNIDEDITRWGRDRELANTIGGADQRDLRQWLEEVHPEQIDAAANGRLPVIPANIHPEMVAEMQAANARRLHEGKALGVGPKDGLEDLVPTIDASGRAVRDADGKIVLKRLQHVPRRLSQGVVEGQSLGSKSLQAKTPDVVSRQEVWKGNGKGTPGTNELAMDPRIWKEIKQFDDPAIKAQVMADLDAHHVSKGLPAPTQIDYDKAIWRRKVSAAESAIGKHWGDHSGVDANGLPWEGPGIVLPKWQTRKHKMAVASAQFDVDRLNDAVKRHTNSLMTAHLNNDQTGITRYTNLINKINNDKLPRAVNTLERAKRVGINRYRAIAKKLVGTPEMEAHGVFNNDVLYDARMAGRSHARRVAAAPTIYKAIHKGIDDVADDKTVEVGKFLKSAGFHDNAPDLIAALSNGARTGHEVAGSKISKKLAEQLQSLTPNYKVPEAESWLGKALRGIGATYKANVLAMPSSRSRDIGTAAIDAVLRGHLMPGSHRDALSIMQGAVLSPERAAAYAESPRIQAWLSRRNTPATAENVTEALRQLLGTAFEHGLVKDIAPGQVGSTLSDMMQHVPGRDRITSRQAAKMFAETISGRNRPDPKWHDWINPFPEGVFGAEHTRSPLLAASNEVAGVGDTMNRYAATLGQLEQGHGFDQAVAATKGSQVDYNPETFSQAEAWLRRYAFPFMSYYSRKGADVAGELLQHPGGRTAQVVKGVAKAHQADPSVPDNVSSGLSIPLGVSADGTKKYLTGFGMMHEQPVNTAGKFLGGNIGGGFRELLGMTYPWVHAPIEIGTDTNLFTGNKLSQQEGGIGRTLSNIGVVTGLRSEKEGRNPITWPGSKAMEYVVSKLPGSRSLGAARTITDPRADVSAGEKALQLLSGVRTQNISPQMQQRVLRKRMQDVAQGLGAREISDIYFTPEQMARMQATNPTLVKDIEQLRAGINSINRKSRAARPKVTKKKEKHGSKAPVR
jgi:hypothetical protein